MFLFTLAFNSCGNKGAKAMKGKEYSSAYICPMHCDGSGSDKPGVCPVCGMDYEINKDNKAKGDSKEGHNHDGHNHDGHNHEGHNH